MSLIWIKVDREKKTHSIYCDGIQLAGSTIDTSDAQKILAFKNFYYSVLLGVTGEVHGANYIKKQLEIKLNNAEYIKLDDQHINRNVTELIEKIAEDYKQKYNEYPDNSLILSINGNLFKINLIDTEINRWNCVKTNNDFIACGAPYDIATALFYYDKDIKPQTLLDTVCKVTNTINNNLISIENVEYK